MKRFGMIMKRGVVIAIAVLAIFGLIDSIYLTLEYYELVGNQPEMLAEICTFDDASACSAAVENDGGSVCGIPYSILGAAYFALVLGATATKLRLSRWPAPGLVLALLVFGLGFSAFLSYLMIADTAGICPYCLAAHAANGAMLILFAVSLGISGRRFRLLPHHPARST